MMSYDEYKWELRRLQREHERMLNEAKRVPLHSIYRLYDIKFVDEYILFTLDKHKHLATLIKDKFPKIGMEDIRLCNKYGLDAERLYTDLYIDEIDNVVIIL